MSQTQQSTCACDNTETCRIVKGIVSKPFNSVDNNFVPHEDERDDTTRLEDVWKRNGEEHLYDKSMELAIHVQDASPLIFGWQNVEAFVKAIRTAQHQAAAPGGLPLPPNPLALPDAVNVQDFKEAVLEYARLQGAPGRLNTTCLPCSLSQFTQVACMLTRLDVNPWIQRIIEVGGPRVLPIACVYVPQSCHSLARILWIEPHHISRTVCGDSSILAIPNRTFH